MQNKLERLAIFLLVLVLGLSIGLTAQDDEETQQTIVSKEGGFSATLPPGYPEAVISTEDVKTAMGKVKLTIFTSGIKDAICMMVFCDYSEEDMEGKKTEEILNVMRDEVLNDIDGTLDDEEEYTLDGYPGKKIYFSGDSEYAVIYGQAVFLLVKNRFYQVVFIGADKKAPRKAEVSAFFKSFKLETAPASTDKTWSSDKWGYEITLPPDWLVTQLDEGIGSVVLDFNCEEKSIKGYISIEKQAGRCDDYINDGLEPLIDDYKIKITEEPEGDKDASVVYTSVVDGKKGKHYWRVIDSNGEKISFNIGCSKSDYAEYEELFLKYAATLKTIPKKPKSGVYDAIGIGGGGKQKDKTWTSDKWGFEVTLPADWELKIMKKKQAGSSLVADVTVSKSLGLGINMEEYKGSCDDYNKKLIEENISLAYETEILDSTKNNAEAITIVKGTDDDGNVAIFYMRTIDLDGTKFQFLACVEEKSYEKYKDDLAKYAKTLKSIEEEEEE